MCKASSLLLFQPFFHFFFLVQFYCFIQCTSQFTLVTSSFVKLFNSWFLGTYLIFFTAYSFTYLLYLLNCKKQRWRPVFCWPGFQFKIPVHTKHGIDFMFLSTTNIVVEYSKSQPVSVHRSKHLTLILLPQFLKICSCADNINLHTS